MRSARGDSTACASDMSMGSFTGRPAVSPHEQRGLPNFDELEGPEEQWDQLIQKDRVCRQQYGEPNDEKRPHLEEHFSVENAGWYHQGSAQARLPLEKAAGPRSACALCTIQRGSCTHVHPGVSHRYPFYSTIVQFAKWDFRI